ncbi:MAG TPA: SRPBCC family protein [Chitinophagaceae bacterium]|nr:SRPBCC family protein [Chitinophagaceae bacterium]HNU14505.1 SRPBCC family protein [Chitinophagaceae bacterium]
MKYTNEVEINQPLSKVIELFDNPANMPQWQPGFISMEPISGTPGQPGAKSKLKYKMGKRDIEMIETITARNLPKEFHGTYEAKGVYNVQKNFFIETASGKTKWVSESEFKFSGMMKLIGWLMPGTFKRQSQKYLDLFKAFAEKQN